MDFAFFYPLAWLGAAAISLPIWLHLHRRRESNLILFSALRFLDDQPIARRQPLWPRDLPLLLLRILGLLLLVSAFAWPYLIADEPRKLITESTVYILDNTLSHQAGGKFEAARESLADQLEASPTGRQAAVIELTSAPRVVGGFGDDPRTTGDVVRKREPSFGRGSYLAAFRQADELLRQSLGEQRRIVLFADHQTNQWQDGRQSPPFLRNVEVEYSVAADESLANVAVWEPKAQRIVIGDQVFIQCSMRLFHQGPADKVVLQVSMDGELVGSREIEVKGEPKIMGLAFEWASDNRDWMNGEVRVSADPNQLLGDDRAVFSLPPARPGTVDALAKSTYLRTALSPEIMQDRWTTHWRDPDKLAATSAADVLLIETSQLDRKPTRDFVLEHLKNGRGVILMIDELSSSASAFLKLFDVEAQPRVETSGDARIRYFYSEHPLLAPFQSKELGNLLEISVSRYYPLASDRGVPLIFAHSGEPIAMQVPAKGPLLLFGFALDRRDTNWPIHTSFIPFLDLCLMHARPLPPALEAFVPGEACIWQVPESRDVRQIVLRRDDQEVLRATVDQGQARFALPPLPGLYALHYDDSSEPSAMLEVNPSPAESDLTYTNPKEILDSWRVPAEVKPPATQPLAEAGPLSEASILRQQIWWWLLLAGAAALVIETGWLALRKDRK